MKLLTKEIEKKLPAYGATEKVALEDKVAICKFFDPMGSWTWYAVEYDPIDKIFFGLVDGFEKEWGDFSLDELESIGKTRILGIERDISFEPTKISELTR